MFRSGDTTAKWPTVVRLPTGLANGRRTPEAPVRAPARTAEADWTPSLGTYTGCAKIRFHFEGEHTYLDLYLILRVRFETVPCPKPGCESACFPQGLFPPPKTRPWVFRHPKRPVFIENLGIACPPFPQEISSAPKTRPWFFCGQKSPFLAPGTRRPLPGGAHIKSDPTIYIYIYYR